MADSIILAYLRMENGSESSDRLSERFCQDMFAFWYGHRDYLRIMVCSECLGLFTESFTRIILDSQLGFDMRSWPEQEQQAVSVFTTSGFISLLIYWVHHGFRETPEEVGNLFYRMLTRPMYL